MLDHNEEIVQKDVKLFSAIPAGVQKKFVKITFLQ